jgi:pentafunctional AROM polypeptide
LVKNRPYKSPGNILIEPDAGSASYFFALAAAHQKTVEVRGLGSSSLQGELEFVRVLEKMGCEVEISTDSTKVTGKPLTPAKVDMNNCTDSFITASVLMATCSGTSEISGISNQRVKESNRILAVVTELSKLGVYAEEKPDGLLIHGGHLRGHAKISTYNDHRIAMGFSVLSSLLPSVQIKEKHVVSKTFPNFWKSLSLTGLHLDAGQSKKVPKNLVIIGMRGVGKSTQGKAIAEELHWKCKDIDTLVQEKLQVESLATWIEENGIQAFRHLEYEELVSCLNDEKTVIICGGGIVEYPKAVPVLLNHFPVVWIRTSKVIAKKNLEEESPHRFAVNFEEAYQRRRGLYSKVADFQFYFTVRDLPVVRENFLMFVDKVLGQKAKIPANYSAFGCITEKTKKEVIQQSKFLTALEIRSDCYSKMQKAYKDLTGVKDLVLGIQTIFTYRGDVDQKYWKILKHSLRFIPDFIDVQYEPGAEWYLNYLHLKKHAGSTRILLSYHSESTENAELTYKQMKALSPDILKFIAPYTPTVVSKSPEIVFALGIQNSITRVLNTFFSPVRVDVPMGKGQLSFQELVDFQESFSVKEKNLKVYLAGNNISRSPASRLYNALFKEYGIDWNLEFLQTDDVGIVVETLKQPGCMGMLITIPFKQTIMPFLDIISDEAKAVGSVNTIVKYKHWLIGHNTDWHGLYYPIQFALQNRKNLKTCKTAILGAGGTSKAALYALDRLGLSDITLWNRSAERLTSEWKCKTTTNLEEIQDSDLIISTIPGNSEVKLTGLSKDSIVVEAAYFPDPTFIGQQALNAGSTLITGKDMYLYMALHQFPLFTGRSITRGIVSKHLSFS